MAKQLDPELLRNIRIIYGDTQLDKNVLKLLLNVWKTNPLSIINTARQKMASSLRLESPVKPSSLNLSSLAPTLMELLKREVDYDDLTSIPSFGLAFREARNRGLKTFKWGKTVYGTLLESEVKKQNDNLKPLQQTLLPNLRPLPVPSSSSGLPNKQDDLRLGNEYIAYKVYNTRYPRAGESLSWNPEILPEEEAINIWKGRPNKSQYGKENDTDFDLNRGFSPYEIFSYRTNLKPIYYLQGGTMNNQEELQKAFLAFLILDAAQLGILLQSEQDLQAYAEQLGEEGIKAKYQEFIQKMLGGSVKAKLGAKLMYINKLKGVCPEGYEMTYYKVGGRLCTSCQKKAMAQNGKKLNTVDKFKLKRKEFKKDMSKGDLASKDSIAINKWNDLETLAERGNRGKVKNGTWTPDRSKYSKKD